MDFFSNKKVKLQLEADKKGNTGSEVSTFWGIRNRLIVIFLAIAFIPMILVGFFVDRNIRSSAQNDFTVSTTRAVSQVDNAIVIFFDGMKKNLKMLADNPVLRQPDGTVTSYIDRPAGADGMIQMDPLAAGGYEASAYSAFGQIVKSHPEVSVISLGTADGGYLQYPAVPRKKGYDSRARDWFKDTVKQPDKLLLADPFLTSKGVPTIGIFTTVRDQANAIKGVLGFNIDLPVITEMLKNIKLGETGYVILLDSKDTIIANPKQPELNFKKVQDMNVPEFNNLDAIAGSSVEVTLDGASHFATVVLSPSTGWKYLCVVDKAEVMAGSAHLRQVIIIAVLITLLLVCFVAFTVSNQIARPLQTMVKVCHELAAGDFRDKPRRLERNDEIGQLANAMASMRTRLREVLKKVNESAEQVAASSEELTASAEQSAQAVTQVAESVNGVAEGAQKQSAAVNAAAKVVEQISGGIEQAAASSSRVAEHSGRAAEKAKEGDTSVEQAINQMGHIEQTVNNSAQVVAKLGDRSKEIGQIVDTISGIAGQTNLLALNAAIEAARAGEQGRGFAVVAEEVRKLAEQSQDAAKQIAELISGIQGETDKAVAAMTEGTHEVKIGTEVVTTAGRAFGEIAALVMNVSDQVKEISTAINHVAGGSQQIVASIQTIDAHSKTAVDEAQMVSAATEEQTASMEEIASASQSLAKLAQELQEAVSLFKI